MTILKSHEKHKIPLSVMHSIINDVQSLFQIFTANISEKVQEYLLNVGVSHDVSAGIDPAVFNECPRVFEGLQTQQQQLSYFRMNFNFIVCEITVLNT